MCLALAENAADGGKSRCGSWEPLARTDLTRARTWKGVYLLVCCKPRGRWCEGVERDRKTERVGLWNPLFLFEYSQSSGTFLSWAVRQMASLKKITSGSGRGQVIEDKLEARGPSGGCCCHAVGYSGYSMNFAKIVHILLPFIEENYDCSSFRSWKYAIATTGEVQTLLGFWEMVSEHRREACSVAVCGRGHLSAARLLWPSGTTDQL